MDITKIFYESIIPEATIGKINVYFFYSVAFSTMIVEENKFYKCKIDTDDVLIPTLIIKDKETFDRLLCEYVTKAMNFYDDSNFYEEILNYNKYDNKEMICREKFILMYLFSNATVEDFSDPISFLRKRIAFIDNHQDKKVDLGYSDILDANLEINILSDTINNETASQFVVRAYDFDNSWIGPRVKFGISEDTIYIYAIQNEDTNDNPFCKKFNRKLYKVGEGFNEQDGEENLKDVTASFLFVLNMAISYFKSLGYEKIVVPSILITRWNAKKIIIDRKYMVKKIDDEKKKQVDMQLDTIQSNLTNKLIRTFLRLSCHYNNVIVDSFPYEVDSALHIKIDNSINMNCNNKLLLETGKMIKKKQKGLKK